MHHTHDHDHAHGHVHEHRSHNPWSLVTKEAPDFTAKAVLGDNSIEPISLSKFRGKNVVLFFYPMDFTFVCPTEILAFNKNYNKFKERNTEVLGVSIDSHHVHLAWKNTETKNGGIGKIDYPIVSDLDKNIARSYGVLLDNAVALRGTFLIDTKGIVRHATINDLPIGRSIDETLRTLDALLFHEKHGEVCPANWTEGQDTMKESPEAVANYLSKHS